MTETWGISDYYAILIRSVVMMSSNLNTVRNSRRIGYATILLAGMLLYWLWEACLISYFAAPSRNLPFSNLEEFLTNTNKKVYF